MTKNIEIYFNILILLIYKVMISAGVKCGESTACPHHMCSYQNLQDYLATLQKVSSKNVKTEVIAQTDIGYDVNLIKVSDTFDKGNANDENIDIEKQQRRLTVWVDAMLNPSDWVSLPAALYLLEQLTGPVGCHKQELDGIDWYIVPLANPSGYEFSRKVDRTWKKNLEENKCGCINCGVNLNRNFDIHFYDGDANPCSDVFRGVRPTSEPEIKALSHRIANIAADGLDLYISLQAANDGKPRILLPWMYADKKCPGYDKMQEAAKLMSEAVENTTGRIYQVEHAGHNEAAGGTSTDFAKAVGAKSAFTVQLQTESKELAANEAFVIIVTAVQKLMGTREERKASAGSIKIKTDNVLFGLFVLTICSIILCVTTFDMVF